MILKLLLLVNSNILSRYKRTRRLNFNKSQKETLNEHADILFYYFITQLLGKMGHKVENRSPSPDPDGLPDQNEEKILDEGGMVLITCTDYINDARENYFNLGYAFARENDRFESFRWMKWKKWNLILQLTTLTHVITAFFERTIIMNELRSGL